MRNAKLSEVHILKANLPFSYVLGFAEEKNNINRSPLQDTAPGIPLDI